MPEELGSDIGARPPRHAAAAVSPLWKLVLKLLLKPKYTSYLPSNYAWMVLRRKYDAFTTDRAYENRPASWLGPLGRWADRRVLDFPLHVALRERLRNVTDSLVEQIADLVAQGHRPVRVLSAPCGLCHDPIDTAAALRRRNAPVLNQVEFHARDLDAAGDVIPEARRRAAVAGLTISFYREDIFCPTNLMAEAKDRGAFHLISCIGLTAWLKLTAVHRLLTFFHLPDAPRRRPAHRQFRPARALRHGRGLGNLCALSSGGGLRTSLGGDGLQGHRAETEQQQGQHPDYRPGRIGGASYGYL